MFVSAVLASLAGLETSTPPHLAAHFGGGISVALQSAAEEIGAFSVSRRGSSKSIHSLNSRPDFQRLSDAELRRLRRDQMIYSSSQIHELLSSVDPRERYGSGAVHYRPAPLSGDDGRTSLEGQSEESVSGHTRNHSQATVAAESLPANIRQNFSSVFGDFAVERKAKRQRQLLEQQLQQQLQQTQYQEQLLPPREQVGQSHLTDEPQESSASGSLQGLAWPQQSFGSKTSLFSNDAMLRTEEPLRSDQASVSAASDARSGRSAAPSEGSAAPNDTCSAEELPPGIQSDVTSTGTPPVPGNYLRKVASLEFERNRLHHELAQLRRTLSVAQAQRAKYEASESKAAALQTILADKERELVERDEQIRLDRKRAGDAIAELQAGLTRRETEAAALAEQCEWLRKESTRLLERERRLQGQVSRQTSTTDLSVVGRAKSNDSIRQDLEIVMMREQNEVLRKENARLLELEERLERQLVQQQEALSAAAAVAVAHKEFADPPLTAIAAEDHKAQSQLAADLNVAGSSNSGEISMLKEQIEVLRKENARLLEMEQQLETRLVQQQQEAMATIVAASTTAEQSADPPLTMAATEFNVTTTQIQRTTDSTVDDRANLNDSCRQGNEMLKEQNEVLRRENARLLEAERQLEAQLVQQQEAMAAAAAIAPTVKQTADPPLTAVAIDCKTAQIQAQGDLSVGESANSSDVLRQDIKTLKKQNEVLCKENARLLEVEQQLGAQLMQVLQKATAAASAVAATAKQSPGSMQTTVVTERNTVQVQRTTDLSVHDKPNLSDTLLQDIATLKEQIEVLCKENARLLEVAQRQERHFVQQQEAMTTATAAAATPKQTSEPLPNEGVTNKTRIHELEMALADTNRRLCEAEASAARRGKRLLQFEERLHQEADRRRKLDAQIRDESKRRVLAEERAAELAGAVKRSTEELRSEEYRTGERWAAATERESQLRSELQKAKEALRLERERCERERERERDRETIGREREQVEKERERDRVRVDKAREDAEVHHLVAAAEREARAWRSMEEAAQEEIRELQQEVDRLRAAIAAHDAVTTTEQDGLQPQTPKGTRMPVGEPESVSAFLANTLERMKADIAQCESKAEEEEFKARKLQELTEALNAELTAVKEDCHRWKVAAQTAAGLPAADCDRQCVSSSKGLSTTAFRALHDFIIGNMPVVNGEECGRAAALEDVVASNPAEALLRFLRSFNTGRVSATPEVVAELTKQVDAMIGQIKKLRDDNARLATEVQEARETKHAQGEAWLRRHSELKEQLSRAEKNLGAWESAGAEYQRMWQSILAKSEVPRGPRDGDDMAEGTLPWESGDGPKTDFECRAPGFATLYYQEVDEGPKTAEGGDMPENARRKSRHREQQQRQRGSWYSRWRHPLPFLEHFRHLLASAQAAQHTLSRMRAQMQQLQELEGRQREEAALARAGLEKAEAEKERAEKLLQEFASTLEKVKVDRDSLRLKLRKVGVGFKALVLSNNMLDVSLEA